MLTDLEAALQVQLQYDGQIVIEHVAGIDYSIITTDPDAIDVILEGSKNLPDYERDFSAIMVYIPRLGWVHGGFWEGLNQAVEAVIPLLDDHKLIRIKGHSLGAAEASLVTCILGMKGFKNLDCVTWGCPLFGDAQVVAFFNQFHNRTYWNYKNPFEHDIVGSVPLSLPAAPYVAPPNRIKNWSAPTSSNPWGQNNQLIAPHNMKDCYIPLMKGLQNG